MGDVTDCILVYATVSSEEPLDLRFNILVVSSSDILTPLIDIKI